MEYTRAIEQYRPRSPGEEADKRSILWCIQQFGDSVLTRNNPVAHLCSSGFVLSPDLSRVLLVHHNIYGVWAWTGGHADGERDLLDVAMREAREETGAEGLRPLTEEILSLDVLPVQAHLRRGVPVAAHLHLSAAYVLTAPLDTPLKIRPQENSGVRWFPVEALRACAGEETHIAEIYLRLVQRAKEL